jgi:CheY-like chemotaxis protein
VYVLIVEDDDEIRGLLHEVLADEGFDVRDAADGAAALGRLDEGEGPPAVILLDLMMPEMDGFELLERLAGSARFRAVPVVLTTAAPDKARRRLTPERSGLPVVTKPYDLGAVLEVVRRYARAA